MTNQHPSSQNASVQQEQHAASGNYPLILSALILVSALSLAWKYTSPPEALSPTTQNKNSLEEQVLPSNGILLPITWNDLGIKMVSEGIVDAPRFEALYFARGGLAPSERALLYENVTGPIRMTRENSSALLNLLWAAGLGNRNNILEYGPMADPKYGSPDKFASTGGWSLAKGNVMTHYSMHSLVRLTPDQQEKVERVAKGVHRPCCGNSTYFPDCNHGMAMLGLLELMAANNVSEDEMYRVALRVNSYWFPDTYLTIASYFQKRGVSWDRVDAKEVLGVNFSSGQGFARVKQEVEPIAPSGGGSCGV